MSEVLPHGWKTSDIQTNWPRSSAIDIQQQQERFHMPKKKSSQPKKTYDFQVVFEIDEDGKYVASCPALEACYTQGDTFEEAAENIRDVIAMCVAELKEANLVP